MQPNPFSWKTHSLALGGPLALWVAFLYSRGAALEVFGENLNVMLLGMIPGMSLGYFLCLLKLKPKDGTAAPDRKVPPPPPEDGGASVPPPPGEEA